MEIMKPFIGGQFVESKSEKFNTIYNPSTGEAIAQVPCCTKEEVEQAIACAKAAGCTMSYDPNYRASLWESPEAASEQMRSIAGSMDLIKISAEECALMTGETDPEAAAAALLAGGASVVCVTLDADGAYVAAKDGARIVPSFRVDAVDTTGAGDSFWGGFLAAFVESGRHTNGAGVTFRTAPLPGRNPSSSGFTGTSK